MAIYDFILYTYIREEGYKMIKSILVMSRREVELEKIKLQAQGLLADSCFRLDEMLQALKLQEVSKNVKIQR